MNRLKIGLDCDQVLVDFMGPYLKRFGNPKNDYEISKNVFNILRFDRNFWLSTPVINIPDFMPTLICSKRVHPKAWSKKMLKDKFDIPYSVPFYQIYLQSGRKSKKVAGKIDVFIDDSISNFLELNNSGVPCLLMDTEWNKHFPTPLRVYSLKYEEIEYVYKTTFTWN